MAVSMNQNLGFKFFCRICKKGFGCGRALGGHMRAHGIGDDSSGGHIDDNDGPSDWEEYTNSKVGNGGTGSGAVTTTTTATTTTTTTPPTTTNKRMYALRTNPNRLRSCRVCENCGKEFSSWKSFLEHGKCASEDAESLVSSPDSDEEEEEEEEEGPGCGGWSKGKRSRRVVKVGIGGAPPLPAATREEEDLAHCLVLLSTARVEPPAAETESSCASASKEADQERHRVQHPPAPEPDKAKAAAAASPRGLFECKACKKVFNSHQALGGHRASHKKVKGCFAAKLADDGLDDSLVDDDDVVTHDDYFLGAPSKTAVVPFDALNHVPSSSSTPPTPTTTTKRKSKVHECSICHRVFASGQALGGHKRCHWVTSSNSNDITTTTSMAKLHQLQQADHHHHAQTRLRSISQPALLVNNNINNNKSEPLDLNLPAPIDETITTPVLHRDQNATTPTTTPLHELETALYLQQWIGLHSTDIHNTNINHINKNNNNNDDDDDKNINTTTTIINNNAVSVLNPMIQVDDEADSKIKLAKLSDLKDINMGGGSSPWLQVGIGSTANGGITDP